MTTQPKHSGITLAELAASGRHIVVQCGECANRRLSRPIDLDLPMDTPVNLVGALLKCCECGSRELLAPESAAWLLKSPQPGANTILANGNWSLIPKSAIVLQLFIGETLGATVAISGPV